MEFVHLALLGVVHERNSQYRAASDLVGRILLEQKGEFLLRLVKGVLINGPGKRLKYLLILIAAHFAHGRVHILKSNLINHGAQTTREFFFGCGR